ncbi:glycosyltransferase family 2 protein [Vibrio parahaemolyticus]|uniref:glycosyltransferase family 2 protein n=1 Tax=Vibrio parahaemolyticus TaxID=670 RepID=UPI001869A244|nr:glycosyltransferase [Vibrio parahaemolyticus]MBE4374406.1 glycosyltransferase family 2 protein [Vibrio parahaemolyticus]MBE4430332.1 glycosyltransferase family 2 protein [Vibrio parahaemolyticus]MEA5235888.1 glycosyltransferase family 2 protein [Vibrio parahaemolyticus]HCE3717594.1 glycosyltransferase family 2 protein [Vibrio parahaemolyticus]HCG5525337.1 glycosyltransferase family 2 protein [Vibrio parahaemolyticus]
MINSTPSLAVALIVKNEAKHLKACLETVHDWVNEIIILDSGSTDETESIARCYTNKFFTNSNWVGFGPQRQLAQSYVTSDYILWLDADERVTPELKSSILSAIKEDQPNTLYKIDRLTTAFGKKIRYSGWSPDWVTRLYRTQDTQYNDSLVHESVVTPTGYQVKALSGYLEHYTYEYLTQYTAKTQHYMKAWADQRDGHKEVSLSSAILHGLFRFIKMYIIKRGFLDGRHGLVLAILSANTTFTRYADLWLRSYLRQHNKQSKR